MLTSRLFYYGTTIEVEIGDHILVSRFLRSRRACVVCYIPGLSERRFELEFDDVRQWAIRDRDGTVYSILYDPESFQPPKHIRFVNRGVTGKLQANDILE
jgi:hypothetical protein